jgi:hypothetical protein
MAMPTSFTAEGGGEMGVRALQNEKRALAEAALDVILGARISGVDGQFPAGGLLDQLPGGEEGGRSGVAGRRLDQCGTSTIV